MNSDDNARLDRRTVLKLTGAAGIAGGVPAAVGAAESDDRPEPDEPRIDSALAERWNDNEMITVVARLERIDRSRLERGDRDAVATDLRTHARDTQQRLLAWADSEDGVRVVNRHWIANAVVLKVRTAEVQPTDITARENVRWLHPNVEIEIPAPAEVNDVGPDATYDDVTYGLDQINAPDVWDQLGVTGDGAEVAVLDTGINADHPDFGDFDPDNWQEFDGDGQPVDSEPFDDNGHGSHVSGTTAGPMEPDGDGIPAYGVAPDAELWHAKVLDALGGGTFTQVIAGMEWAVDETTADVVGMSLGGGATETTTLEATEHIWDAGLILSASNGNSTLSSPGAYYSSFGSQAIDENNDLASFAVGEWIEPEEFFDNPDEIPDYWPDEYVTPDASAAGVDVLSLYPDEYAEISGTSMSQPHKAGVFALMISASGGIDRDWFWETVNETAWQPEQAPDPDPNAEYGHGIVDALEATQLVALDQNVEGQVTDADGDPIAGAEVTVADPGSTGQTDDDGFYDVIAAAGDNTVTAGAFGFGDVSHDVTVPEEGTATQDFDLPTALDAVVDEPQADAIEAGEAIETTLTVAHPETITVTNDGEYDGELALVVDGQDAAFGEPVELGGPVGDVDVVVETEADDSGVVELEHALEGVGDEIVLTTGTTEVYEELFEVGVIDDTEGYGNDWVDILDDELSGVFEVAHVSSDDALEEIEAYDSYFVHGLDAANEDEWFDATDGVGTVYTAQNLGPDTLEQRADVVGDPSSVEIDTGLTTWTITESHEILEGVAEPGDEIEIHTDTFDDGASFGDTDADVYADAADGTNAFAVDEDRRDVLLTAVGLGWVSAGDHTDDGLAVVANAVEYTAMPQEPAAIAVVNDEVAGVPAGHGRDVVDRLESQLEFEYEMALLDGEEAVAAAADGEHDVYVLNHIDPDHVEVFDEHTAGTDTGVVWLDQWGNQGSNAVSSRSDVLGVPEDTGDGRSGGGQNPNLEVVAEHPIVEAIGDPGHMVRIHDADRPDHSWFEGYDGDVIGRIQSSSVSDGDGIGVDDETGTVLLSSFGSSRNVAGDDYSAAADAVLGNAVGYLVSAIDAVADARPAAPAMTADD